jgi:electron transfer flavoprotein beta subunit
MKAKKKPVTKKALDAFGIDVHPRLEILKMAEPPRRKAGVKVASVTELINKLKTEAGVLQ